MGRKPIKIIVQSMAMQVMEETEMPVTCAHVRRKVSKKIGREIHFDTVKKYLEDLARKKRLFRKQLPPAKPEHKSGMVLYSKKPFPDSW